MEETQQQSQQEVADAVAPTGEVQLDAVRKQIEYYFSKENLLSDSYLISQMDSNQSVPISVVMKFAKLKALTQDEVIVRKSLEESTIVTIIDNNRIKGVQKSGGRNTVILREIPSDTPEEEVRQIFSYEGSKAIVSVRVDVGDTWFVTFETEDEAKDTLLDLKLKKRTFRGAAVKTRLKSDTMVRSFYTVTAAAPPLPVFSHYGNAYMGGSMPVDLRNFGYVNTPGADGAAADVAEPTDEASRAAAANRKQAAGGRTGTATNAGRGDFGADGRRQKDGKRAVKTEKGKDSDRPAIEINSANFPPLGQVDEAPIPVAGYTGTYTHYTVDEIAEIVKGVKEAVLPSTIIPANHPLALTLQPNMDLLKRQRTFSIDETREQLRQGRPVQREAIISGAVDYRSFVYGDDNHTSSNTSAAPEAHVAPKESKDHRSNHQQGATHHAAPAPAVTTPAVAAPAPSPLAAQDPQPKKISQSTWAAMVKSSAAATEAPVSPVKAAAVAPRPATAPAPAAAAASSRTPAKAAAGSEGKKSTSKDTTDKSKPAGDAKERRRPEKAKKEGGKTDDAASASAQTTDNAAASAAAPSLWGGKQSFATVLKTATAEDAAAGITSASPVSPVKPKTDAGSQAPAKSASAAGSHSGEKGNRTSTSSSSASKPSSFGEGRKGPHATATVRKPLGSSSTGSSGANSSGVWVKETLPALPTK